MGFCCKKHEVSVSFASVDCVQVDGLSKGSEAGSPQAQEFENMLQVAHYYSNRAACMQHKSLVRSWLGARGRLEVFDGCSEHRRNVCSAHEVCSFVVRLLMKNMFPSTGHPRCQTVHLSSATIRYHPLWQGFLRSGSLRQGNFSWFPSIYSVFVRKCLITSLFSLPVNVLKISMDAIFWMCGHCSYFKIQTTLSSSSHPLYKFVSGPHPLQTINCLDLCAHILAVSMYLDWLNVNVVQTLSKVQFVGHT